MPGFNQSGPNGEGTLTGRQRGMCQRTDNQLSGGMGSGRGRGMGMRCGGAPMSGQGRRSETRGEPLPNPVSHTEKELATLKEQYQAARKLLGSLEEKIAALEAGQ